jgi:hypothetical protein
MSKMIISPKTVEDLIQHIANVLYQTFRYTPTNGTPRNVAIKIPYDVEFLTDIGYKIAEGKGLSERQSQLFWKIVNKHLEFVIASGVDEAALMQLIDAPVYRTPLYKSIAIPREVRYLGNSRFAVRFNFNPTVKHDLQASVSECKWNSDYKFWIILLKAKKDYETFPKFLKKHKFELDNFSKSILEYMIYTSNTHGADIQQNSTSLGITVVGNQVLENLLLYSWQEKYETL